jgi:predicted RNase H-like HicB family nuclease
MKEYGLYLESGPKMRKSMAHILNLLGCITRGVTTEQALSDTPDAIRKYLHFLSSSGEPVDPEEAFTLKTITHVIGGGWVGEGNPTLGFAPDFLPLSKNDHNLYVSRLSCLHSGMLKMLEGLPISELLAEPANGHRSLYRILEHAAESEYTYLRMQLGPVKEISAAKKLISPTDPGLIAALQNFWALTTKYATALTDDDLTRLVPHGQVTWSAYRMMRRMLEHNWEHYTEIRERLAENFVIN